MRGHRYYMRTFLGMKLIVEILFCRMFEDRNVEERTKCFFNLLNSARWEVFAVELFTSFYQSGVRFD